MREILFKAKRTDTDTWAEGNLLAFDSRRYIINDTESIYYCPQCDREEMREMWFAVIPETVSQFTGLYDKNGVRIFENDIVRFTCTPSWLYQVIWDKESAMFGLKCVKSPSLYNKESCGTNFYDIDSRDVEIIGNRFDNPDLLN